VGYTDDGMSERAEERSGMISTWILLGVLVAWVLLQFVVLPRFGLG
jgi:hypothetical protein